MENSPLAHDRVVTHHNALKENRLALDHALAPDNCPPDFGPFTYVTIAPDDAAVDVGPIVDDSIVTYNCRPVDDHATLDLDLVAQEDGPVELGIWGYLDILAGPDIPADVLAHLVSVDAVMEYIGGGAYVLGDVAHVRPAPVGHVAEQGPA